jgi:hypothetical protein
VGEFAHGNAVSRQEREQEPQRERVGRREGLFKAIAIGEGGGRRREEALLKARVVNEVDTERGQESRSEGARP